MVNVKVTTKRCVSAVMAFLMVAMLVLGVSASPLTQVFAASATKKLKSGDVTVELDKSCAATNVSVDIKTAAEGLHDFTFGDNGLSGIINLTDKDGNKVEYTGTIKVTYTLPDDWNLNYGIKALTVSGSSLGDYKFLR